MYSRDRLENNCLVSHSASERRIAATWAPLDAGALLRLSIGGAVLSVSWSHPAAREWAVGLGVAAEGEGAIAWSEGAPLGMPGPWFGGWTYAGVERWVLPKVLAWWANGKTYAAAFGDARLDQVQTVEPVMSVPKVKVSTGDRAAWTAMIEAAVKQFAGGKVVLARRIEVRAEAPIEERRLLKVLEARYPACRSFLLREGTKAFVGATPETLCRVKGRVLNTEALAGTGTGEALLKSAKDLREHAWVVEAIVESLRPLTTSIEVEAGPALKRLANVTHLHTPIRAELREGVDAMVAAKALHPTPAVGGTPRADAIAFQRAHEGFDRGWYAGAIGARGGDHLELCVGIRSGLIDGDRATVYAGAGIVTGSTADAEWEETDRKSRAILGALDG